MKRGLDHLPEGKRHELAFVVEVLREGFAKAIETKRADRLKNGQILKIILFGSYARGDWVEDPVGRYFSDYDLLVVVDHEDLTDIPDYWLETEKRLTEALSAGEKLRTPVSPIYHSLDDVNEQLRLGRYFFIDILRDGISLFGVPGVEFVKPEPLSPEQALSETRQQFETWFESAESALIGAQFYVEKDKPKDAAFLMHQTVERLYHCLLVTHTLYSPKTHNLNRLRSLSEELEAPLTTVWPTDSKFQKRCYELIRQAYVNARYSPHFRITAEELAWIGERIEHLRDRVRDACERRIAGLE